MNMNRNTSSTPEYRNDIQDASRSVWNWVKRDQFDDPFSTSPDGNEAGFEGDGYENGDEGPSPHEYARSIGFCQNFLSEDAFSSRALTVQPWSIERDLDDSREAPCVHDLSGLGISSERLEIPNELSKAVMLLVQRTVEHEGNYVMLSGLPDVRPRRRVKIELPLLATDHDMDMKVFTRVRDVRIDDLKLPLEFVDKELDEGMDWPTRLDNLPAETLERLAKQRIEVPREHLKFLSSIVNEEGEECYSHPWTQIEEYKETKLGPITPPLLPLESPPLACCDRSTEATHLPPLSDNTTLSDYELQEIERRFEGEGRIVSALDLVNDRAFNTDDFAQICIPLQSDLDAVDQLPSTKRKITDLQIEMPLLASDSSTSTADKKRKTVSFSDDLCIYVEHHPPACPIGELNTDSEESLDKFFEEFIKPEALQAERAAEQEQLIAADSLQRIHVRVMDFSLPPPPWSTTIAEGLSTKMKDLNIINVWTDAIAVVKASLDDIAAYKAWKITTNQERELQPYPFDAGLGQVPDELPINDTKYMAILLRDLSLDGVMRSDTLVWKPEGLRVARRSKYEYEEELEVQEYDDTVEQMSDMDSLLFLCQQRIAQAAKSQGFAFSKLQRENTTRTCHKRSGRRPIDLSTMHEQSINNMGTILDTGFTTASSLYALMRVMGQKTNIAPQPFHPPANVGEARIREPENAAKTNDVISEKQAEVTQNEPYALPTIPADAPPRSVIFSVDLLQTHRRMLRVLFKDLYPTAIHIAREFSALKTVPEADMLISPGVGIIFTTLQKLKQKALPGQAARLYGIRDRLVRLSFRYETMIVIVGDAVTQDGLDQHDCEAIADFEAFCIQCKMHVQIQYVPTGDESMASLVASIIYNYDDLEQELNLLHEETMWEQTLRRAGLNAYAAQSVLAFLKDGSFSPGNSSSSDDSQRDFGIGAFMKMNPEQRTATFARMMGGTNVLQRVNRILEQNWLSAKTGYY